MTILTFGCVSLIASFVFKTCHKGNAATQCFIKKTPNLHSWHVHYCDKSVCRGRLVTRRRIKPKGDERYCSVCCYLLVLEHRRHTSSASLVVSAVSALNVEVRSLYDKPAAGNVQIQ